MITFYILLNLKKTAENMIKIIAKYAKVKPLIFCSRGAEHTTNMRNLLECERVPVFSSSDEQVFAAEALIYRK
jgi:hypothetical protein